jgi:hypothetical protein
MSCTPLQCTGMGIKDWITPFILIATIISSHWLASKQTRKTKQVKWIEDLRLEVASIISLSQKYNKADSESILSFSKSCHVATMLLDENIKHQNNLLLEIQAFGIFVSGIVDVNHLQEYHNRVESITNLTKFVIRQEEKKL